MNTRYSLILLTGPKHAGKTSAGQELARLSGGDFTDLDELVEQQTGKSPRTLYQEGPERFRQAEAQALKTVLPNINAPVAASSQRIAAAGGGIIDNEAALKILKARILQANMQEPRGQGKKASAEILIIYLEISAETAWNRINGKGKRLPPFLDTPNPQETHKNLHCRRAAAYKALAHSTVQAEGKTPEAIAQEIASYVYSEY